MIDPVGVESSMSIAGAGGVGRVATVPQGPAASPAPSKAFAEYIYERLDEVNRLQNEADAGVQRLLTGESDNVAEVFAASNKAGIAFDLLMEVRNKLVEAYREIQQMRV